MPSGNISISAEKVMFFRSADGVLHETEGACLSRNFVLQSRPKIKDSLVAHAEFAADGLGQLTVDAVCDWVMKCTPEILAILTPLVTPIAPPVRRRRTKAEIALEKAGQALLQAQNGAKSVGAVNSQTLEQFAAQEAGLLANIDGIDPMAAGKSKSGAAVGDGESTLIGEGQDGGSGFPD